MARSNCPTAAQAHSLLKQLQHYLKNGEVSKGYPETVTVSIPLNLSNYLIHAIDRLEGGEPPDKAFWLVRPRGQPAKTDLGTLMNVSYSVMRKQGIGDLAARTKIGKKLNLSVSAVESALKAHAKKNQVTGYDFYTDLEETFGKEVADEWLNSLENRG